MNFDIFLNSISKIEHIPLPGLTSQVKMSPAYRLELIKQQYKLMENARQAGVMALFYPDREGQAKLILILRKTYSGVHSAQVGFPGGKLESEDPSLEYAALRETFEEVGVPIQAMKVLRAMTSVYIPPSNFMVFPFLGVVLNTPQFIKQDDEVEDLIEVTLDDFLNDDNVSSQMLMTSLGKAVEVPVFLLNGYAVWGATAMILSEIKDLLKKAV